MADFLQTRPSLLLRLRDPRDGEAWTQFVDLYAPLVYGHARKHGMQNADAADLCQEVLSAVAGSVGRLEYDPQRGAFRSWLFTIIRRKLSNWRRSRKNQPEKSLDAEVIESFPAPNGDEVAWEVEWQKRSFTWACTQVRLHVTEVTWQAFWRTFIDGQPSKQVAKDLGLTVGAVYLVRRRVLSRLKDLVQSVQEP